MAGLALLAMAGIVLLSHVRSRGGPAAVPDNGTATVADAGNAPTGGMLSTDDFIEFWRRRVDRNPADYISYAELAGGFLRRAREIGDVDSYSRADAAVERALKLNPKYETAISYQANLQFARHDFAGALATAQRIHSLNPGSAQALALIGDTDLELGRYDEAQSAYDNLYGIARTSPVLSRLAHLAELRGDPQKAIDLAQQAVNEAADAGASAEGQAWYHLQLANLDFNTGDLDSAQTQYEASLEAFPGYVHALAGLAKVNAARRDYDGAISLYRQVVTRQPIPEYVAAFGDVYRAAGREEEAQQQYALIGAIDALYKANGINTDLQMALFFADHDLKLDDAVTQARDVYLRQPGNIRAADVLSWALYKSGQYEEAIAYSQEALRLGTRDALMLFHAGMINDKLGNGAAARKYLSRALEINPGFSVLYADQAARSLDSVDSLASG